MKAIPKDESGIKRGSRIPAEGDRRLTAPTHLFLCLADLENEGDPRHSRLFAA